MKDDKTLCYLPSYFKAFSPVSVYGQIHNKNMLASIFCDVVETTNRTKLSEVLLNEWDNPKIDSLIEPYLISYPSLEDDDSQILALMSGIKVNPEMMKEASDQYMRTTSRRNQEEETTKEIEIIVNDVKSSMFDIKVVKDSTKKTKFQIKMNDKKFEEAQFEIYFEGYTQMFRLFKKTIKSALKKYSKGFTGIIESYLLTLIGILRRLQLICDLQNGEDVFSLGLQEKQDYTKYIASLKKDLISQGKMLVDLKAMIENSTMPMKTFETLMPYLDNIEDIDRVQTENFCFFFMTIILRQRMTAEYHSILTIEVLAVLIHRNYEVTYSEEDFPKEWDKDYFELRKLMIENTVPNWNI